MFYITNRQKNTNQNNSDLPYMNSHLRDWHLSQRKINQFWQGCTGKGFLLTVVGNALALLEKYIFRKIEIDSPYVPQYCD